MEKLFFKIVHALIFIVALGAFLVIIALSIYSIKLYIDTKKSSIEKVEYIAKKPAVSFGGFDRLAKEQLQDRLQLKDNLKRYVLNVIENGSKGHGYSTGSMPSKLIKSSDANSTAVFVANKLKGDKPLSYEACAQCHGEDGSGMNGSSPSLIELPIYNNIRKKIDNGAATKSDYVNMPKRKRSAYDKYVDSLITLINHYSSKTGQDGVSRKDLSSFLKRELSKYDIENQEEYKTQLKSGLGQLVVYADKYNSIIEVSSMMVEPVQWREYLAWFSREFSTQVSSENQKTEAAIRENAHRESLELKRTMSAKAELLQMLMVIGGAIANFILATIILVLMKIERNTRKEIHQ